MLDRIAVGEWYMWGRNQAFEVLDVDGMMQFGDRWIPKTLTVKFKDGGEMKFAGNLVFQNARPLENADRQRIAALFPGEKDPFPRRTVGTYLSAVHLRLGDTMARARKLSKKISTK